MSVYTSLRDEDFTSLLNHYAIGDLVNYQGILAGIENTNYFVNTTQGEFVLTVFESVNESELPFFLSYMTFLYERGIPCARPVIDSQGSCIQYIKNKPAALVQKLAGKHISTPNTLQCKMLGEVLSKMHLVSPEFKQHRKNSRDLRWCKRVNQQLAGLLDREDAVLVDAELRYQSEVIERDVPQTIIHADLFKDNILFVDNCLTGVIDFYYACNDFMIYDLAVTINDWCINTDYSVNSELIESLLTAYQSNRRLSDLEKDLFPTMLRRAALRFWLSRLLDKHKPKSGELTYLKDPAVFKNILLTHINNKHRYC